MYITIYIYMYIYIYIASRRRLYSHCCPEPKTHFPVVQYTHFYTSQLHTILQSYICSDALHIIPAKDACRYMYIHTRAQTHARTHIHTHTHTHTHRHTHTHIHTHIEYPRKYFDTLQAIPAQNAIRFMYTHSNTHTHKQNTHTHTHTHPSTHPPTHLLKMLSDRPR